jgi:hypothetical protein
VRVNFKSPLLLDEWRRLLFVNPELVHRVLSYAHLIGEINLTEIFRTPEMQKKYYPNEPGKLSVHQYWRGVDISIKGENINHVQGVSGQLNRDYIYDKSRPMMSSYLIHDIGLGPHLHVQTLRGGTP